MGEFEAGFLFERAIKRKSSQEDACDQWPCEEYYKEAGEGETERVYSAAAGESGVPFAEVEATQRGGNMLRALGGGQLP